MKCAYHPASDAVGVCNNCSRGLCPECQVGLDHVLCAACLTAHNKQVAFYFAKQLALSGGLMAATLLALKNTSMAWQQIGALSLMMAFFPFGWSALSRFFSTDGGYFHPVTRWLSLLLHIAVSAMLGWLVGPWQIYKAICQIQKYRSVNAQLIARSSKAFCPSDN